VNIKNGSGERMSGTATLYQDSGEGDESPTNNLTRLESASIDHRPGQTTLALRSSTSVQ